MDYDKIEPIPSKGKSWAVVPIKNNVIMPDNVDWPPIELVSKFYESTHLRHFNKKYHSVLVSELGYYCDLESIKSEDAITWSLFGYISRMEITVQNNFYNDLLKKLNLHNDKIISIELWKTLPHPEKLVPKGPEIDVFILGEKYYFLIECKWTSGIGKNQGKNNNLDQIQIRKMFKDGIGKNIFPQKEGIVLLVANENIDNNLFISWTDISLFNSLPHKEEFRKYLEWKTKYI
jgi:hypothetical protein